MWRGLEIYREIKIEEANRRIQRAKFENIEFEIVQWKDKETGMPVINIKLKEDK